MSAEKVIMVRRARFVPLALCVAAVVLGIVANKEGVTSFLVHRWMQQPENLPCIQAQFQPMGDPFFDGDDG